MRYRPDVRRYKSFRIYAPATSKARRPTIESDGRNKQSIGDRWPKSVETECHVSSAHELLKVQRSISVKTILSGTHKFITWYIEIVCRLNPVWTLDEVCVTSRDHFEVWRHLSTSPEISCVSQTSMYASANPYLWNVFYFWIGRAYLMYVILAYVSYTRNDCCDIS